MKLGSSLILILLLFIEASLGVTKSQRGNEGSCPIGVSQGTESSLRRGADAGVGFFVCSYQSSEVLTTIL